MANGFFLGGLAEGAKSSEELGIKRDTLTQNLGLRTRELDIQEQAQKNAMLRDAMTRNDKDMADMTGLLSQAVQSMKDAGNPPEKVAEAVQPLAQQLKAMAARSGRSPASIDAQLATMLAAPRSPQKLEMLSKSSDMFGETTEIRGQFNPYTGVGTPMKMNTNDIPTGTPMPPGQNITSGQVTGVQVENIPPGVSPAAAVAASPISANDVPVQKASNFNEAALAGVKPELAAIIKNIANYEQFPKDFSVRKNTRGRIMNMVKQYSPDFDENAFQTIQKTRDTFAVGVEGRGIKSLNQTVGHVATWLEDLKALDNFQTNTFGVGTAAANKMREWMLKNKQDPRVAAVLVDGQLVATELEKALRGANTSENLIQEWKERLRVTLTPEEGTATAKSIVKLLGTALNSYGAQYNEAFRTTSGKQIKYRDPTTFLYPETKEAWDRLVSGHGAPSKPSGPVDWRTYFQGTK